MIIQEQSVILVRTGGIWKFWLRNGTSKHGEKSINCFSYSHRQRATYRFLSRSFGFENLDFHWLCTAMLSTISSRSVGCQNLNILTDAHLVLTRTFPTMVVLRIMLGIQTYTNRYCMHEVTDSVIFFSTGRFQFQPYHLPNSGNHKETFCRVHDMFGSCPQSKKLCLRVDSQPLKKVSRWIL
jgi:hypothetical protein